MCYWCGLGKKTEMATEEQTNKLLKELMFDYKKEQVDKIVSFVDMVLERNQHINLTAVKDRDEAMQKHLADSLAVCKLREYQTATTVMDIGTGAGFPGALLAIVSPEKKFDLMDGTLKRLKVIDEFAEKLGISNITTLHARAEEVSKTKQYAGCYDLVVSRAVANLTTLSGWCLPFVKKGGFFISYKGENYQDELSVAKPTIRKHRGEVKDVYEVESNCPEISGHVLIIIEKK